MSATSTPAATGQSRRLHPEVHPEVPPSSARPLTFAYTPDPDDAFHYFALQHGLVPLLDEGGDPLPARFATGHVHDLNLGARMARFDVTAISSAFYPEIDHRYVVLSCGSSVGRGYGPALAVRPGERFASLDDRRVGIPGASTTGTFLLRYFHPGAVPVEMAFDRIAPALAAGEVDAGVLIHEELLHCAESGVEKLECLGRRWCDEIGLPLPVGLVVARRDLGMPLLLRIRRALEASLKTALEQRERRQRALAFARRFGRGEESRHREDFVDKFANRDTLSMPRDVRQGLAELYRRAHERGLIDHRPAVEVV